ncbi:MAG: hypothetical protein ACR2NP_18685 [Pirellulaceae bacterium]
MLQKRWIFQKSFTLVDFDAGQLQNHGATRDLSGKPASEKNRRKKHVFGWANFSARHKNLWRFQQHLITNQGTACPNKNPIAVRSSKHQREPRQRLLWLEPQVIHRRQT